MPRNQHSCEILDDMKKIPFKDQKQQCDCLSTFLRTYQRHLVASILSLVKTESLKTGRACMNLFIKLFPETAGQWSFLSKVTPAGVICAYVGDAVQYLVGAEVSICCRRKLFVGLMQYSW